MQSSELARKSSGHGTWNFPSVANGAMCKLMRVPVVGCLKGYLMGLLISNGSICRALVLLALYATFCSSSFGQSLSRSYDGWNATPASAGNRSFPISSASLPGDESQYRANFATQDGMPGLPPIPSGLGGAIGPTAAMPPLPGGGNAGSAFPNPSVSLPSSSLSASNSAGVAGEDFTGQGSAGQEYANRGAGSMPNVSNNPARPTPAFSLASTQRGGAEVLPPRQPDFGTGSRQQGSISAQPATYPQAVSDAGGASTSRSDSDGLRPIGQPSPNYRGDPYQNSGQFVGQNGFRQIGGGQSIASGLPYVTPPPTNTGRYATSPYSGSLYRNASYQMVSAGQNNTVNAQLASNLQAPGQPASSLVPAQNQNLPQYRNVGIYPTAYQQCNPGPLNYPPPGAVPGAYVPPTYTPDVAPGVYSTNNAGYSPLFSLGQENYNVQLGRGIIGQPTVYVPSQPFRNFIRYLSP